MAKFESKGKELFIDGQKVIKAWESFSGWYWFATKEVQTQDSYLGNDENGKAIIRKNDKIYYGLVQGLEEEWGDFSEGELNEMISKGKAWLIPKSNWGWSGRRV